MKKKVHVMIDIETLSTRSDASVFDIAAVVFEPTSTVHPAEESYLPTFTSSCEPGSDGRVITYDTLQFWETKNKELFEKKKKNAVTSGEKMWAAFRKFLKKIEEEYYVEAYWGNGPSFDLEILRDGLNDKKLLPFYKDRCVRTVVMAVANSVGKKERDFKQETIERMENKLKELGVDLEKHDALFDTYVQISYVKNFYYRFQLR